MPSCAVGVRDVSVPVGVNPPAGAPHASRFDVPAGWYEDPRGGPQYRYWDGEGWTDHIAPRDTSSASRERAAARERRGRGALWLLAVTTLAAFVVGLVLLESPESELTNPLDAAELAQDIGGTVPGMTITEFEDGFTGHPGGLVVGSDGNFWISEQFDNKIATFDIATKKATEFDLPDGVSPHNVYSGPDGNIWFTGLNDNIGVFDIKTHQTRVFRDGITSGAEPHVIIADPTNDRFMWFTELNGSRIARFDRQTEKIVEFDLPKRTLPHGIVPSPDGKSIWWAEQGPDALGVLDLSQGPIDSQQGFLARYRQLGGLPKGSGPHDPLFGPDGNVYLTLQDSNELGRYLVKEGRYETFPVGLAPYPGPEVIEGRGSQSVEDAADPDSLRSFYTLAIGADGRTIFFNAAVENAVGMFNLDTRKVFLLKKGISPGGGPLFLVQGPDKNIWFTEVGLVTNLPGRIARLELKP
jgi:streptogramin lyase